MVDCIRSGTGDQRGWGIDRHKQIKGVQLMYRMRGQTCFEPCDAK